MFGTKGIERLRLKSKNTKLYREINTSKDKSSNIVIESPLSEIRSEMDRNQSKNDIKNSLELRTHRVYLKNSTYNVGWVLDCQVKDCMCCSKKFNFFVRRHHCRTCGNIVCHSCSLDRFNVEHLNERGGSRVCFTCHETISQGYDQMCNRNTNNDTIKQQNNPVQANSQIKLKSKKSKKSIENNSHNNSGSSSNINKNNNNMSQDNLLKSKPQQKVINNYNNTRVPASAASSFDHGANYDNYYDKENIGPAAVIMSNRRFLDHSMESTNAININNNDNNPKTSKNKNQSFNSIDTNMARLVPELNTTTTTTTTLTDIDDNSYISKISPDVHLLIDNHTPFSMSTMASVNMNNNSRTKEPTSIVSVASSVKSTMSNFSNYNGRTGNSSMFSKIQRDGIWERESDTNDDIFSRTNSVGVTTAMSGKSVLTSPTDELVNSVMTLTCDSTKTQTTYCDSGARREAHMNGVWNDESMDEDGDTINSPPFGRILLQDF